DLDNPQNKRFVAAWKKEHGADAVTDFFSVGAYDAMAAIVHAVQATKGKMDGDAAVKSLLERKFDSPQGPIMIDPQTRHIVSNYYLDQDMTENNGNLAAKKKDHGTNAKTDLATVFPSKARFAIGVAVHVAFGSLHGDAAVKSL